MPNASTGDRHASVGTGVDATATSGNSEPFVPAAQLSHHSTTPELSVSEREGISPPVPIEARLETTLDSSSTFAPAAHRDSNTIPRPGSVLQVEAQGRSDEGPIDTLRRPLRQSLGFLSCITFFGGSVLTLLAVGFLIFLWAGGGPVEGGTKAPSPWRAIMLHGWATRSVTLTTLLLRAISAAQAGLCTSMVAALLLEQRGVPISKVVQFSVTRSVNVGPMEFLYMIFSRRVLKVALKLEVLLLFLLASTAFAIQFSSTILISDFGTTRLVQYSNRTIINVAMSEAGAANVASGLSFNGPDLSMVLFGEADSRDDPAPNLLGVSDTGTKRRAFLPFQKEDRIGLQYFSGAAFSMVSRVICMRPSMTATMSFSSEQFISIYGTINYNQSLEDAGHSPTQRCYAGSNATTYCLPTNYTCTLPGSNDPLPNPQWPTAICHFQINTDVGSANWPFWDQRRSVVEFPSGSWPHLVFTTNVPISYWGQIEQSGPVTLSDPTSYGEWVSYELGPGMFVNITSCFSGVNTTLSSLTMTGNINQTETNLVWNTTSSSFEVNPLQTLFGADPIHKTPAQRGILSIMGDIQDPAAPSAFDVNDTSAQDAISSSSGIFGFGASVGVWQLTSGISSAAVCVHCKIFGYPVSDDIAALFQRIINTTGRAAIAIDAYLTILSRSWYYSLLPKFDIPGYVDTAFSAEVLLPLRWNGLTAVLVLVGVNGVLMWVIAALYIHRTRFTLAGNYWHAVAQLVSKDTIPLLEKSGEMEDEDVTEKLDLESEDFLVKLERSAQDGLVTVVKV